jgi:hypothetical protein
LRIYTRAFLVKVMGWEDCEFSKSIAFRMDSDGP